MVFELFFLFASKITSQASSGPNATRRDSRSSCICSSQSSPCVKSLADQEDSVIQTIETSDCFEDDTDGEEPPEPYRLVGDDPVFLSGTPTPPFNLAVVYVKFRQAFLDDKDAWMKAILKEFNSCNEFQVYDTVTYADVPPDQKVVGSMLLLSRKADGTEKARIVVCGNQMPSTEGNIHASVASNVAFRVALTWGVKTYGQAVDISYIDVSTAFLQSEENAEIPPVFVKPPPELAKLGLVGDRDI